MPSTKAGTATEHIEEAIQVESVVSNEFRSTNNRLYHMRQKRTVLL